VSQVAGEPDAVRQGALGVLALVGSGSILIAVVSAFPEFLCSSRSGPSHNHDGERQAGHFGRRQRPDVMPILERLLDG
jgi:hypothetical protein